MKAHVGTDLNGPGAHAGDHHAAASEFNQLPKLLHGQERELYGDQAYWSELHRIAAKRAGVRYRVNRRPQPRRAAERAPSASSTACARPLGPAASTPSTW